MPAGFTKWSPESGETIAERLGTIVAAAMGYEPEDLPWEVPLIELGLDSLMAVRIKNRVEYDFDLPPIQLTAVRDANLYNVEKLIEYAIEHRDEVEQLHEHQKTQTAEEIAGRRPSCCTAGRRRPRRGRRRRPPSPSRPRPPRTCRSRRRRRIPQGPPGHRLHHQWRAAEPGSGFEGRRGGAQPGGGRQGAQLRHSPA